MILVQACTHQAMTSSRIARWRHHGLLLSLALPACAPESRSLGGEVEPAPLQGEVALDRSASISVFRGPGSAEAAYPAGIGDIDGDGFDDIIIADRDYGGPPDITGGAYLFYGRSEGFATREQTVNADAVWLPSHTESGLPRFKVFGTLGSSTPVASSQSRQSKQTGEQQHALGLRARA